MLINDILKHIEITDLSIEINWNKKIYTGSIDEISKEPVLFTIPIKNWVMDDSGLHILLLSKKQSKEKISVTDKINYVKQWIILGKPSIKSYCKTLPMSEITFQKWCQQYLDDALQQFKPIPDDFCTKKYIDASHVQGFYLYDITFHDNILNILNESNLFIMQRHFHAVQMEYILLNIGQDDIDDSSCIYQSLSLSEFIKQIKEFRLVDDIRNILTESMCAALFEERNRYLETLKFPQPFSFF